MKIKLIKSICSLFMLGAAINAQAATWSFAILGDTRDGDFTTTGVSPHLNTIAQKIASLNPDLVVVVGDLCNGDCLTSNTAQPVLTGTVFSMGVWNPPTLYPANNNFSSTTGTGNAKTIYTTEFQNWKAAMLPVFNYNTNTGIPIYTVRGNHENNNMEGPVIQPLKDAYQEAFSSYVPQNGPNISSSDNEIGFSWSLTHNNVTFVAADQYFGYVAPPPNITQSGYQTLNQPWVIQQFQQSTAPYKIFLAHEPLFTSEGNVTTFDGQKFFGFDTNGIQTRTTFWNNIGTAGVRLFLTGHIHLLTVATIPDSHNNPIIQMVAGNGGAPPETFTPFTGPVTAGVTLNYQNGNTVGDPTAIPPISPKVSFGFALATVTDTGMTIQYYSLDAVTGSWSVAAYKTLIPPLP